jgi:hypothetical protein
MVGRIIQEVTQQYYECEVTDEPVVVSKARPMNASNGVEDKTKPTFTNVCKGASHCKKHGELRRGK